MCKSTCLIIIETSTSLRKARADGLNACTYAAWASAPLVPFKLIRSIGTPPSTISMTYRSYVGGVGVLLMFNLALIAKGKYRFSSPLKCVCVAPEENFAYNSLFGIITGKSAANCCHTLAKAVVEANWRHNFRTSMTTTTTTSTKNTGNNYNKLYSLQKCMNGSHNNSSSNKLLSMEACFCARKLFIFARSTCYMLD